MNSRTLTFPEMSRPLRFFWEVAVPKRVCFAFAFVVALLPFGVADCSSMKIQAFNCYTECKLTQCVLDFHPGFSLEVLTKQLPDLLQTGL